MAERETKLGDRRDFWNTSCNPITGYRVSNNYYVGGLNIVRQDLSAEYNFNGGL